MHNAVRSRAAARTWPALALWLTAVSLAMAAEPATNGPLLTLDRIFNSEEFHVESYGSVVWSKRQPGYFKLEKTEADGEGQDLVRYDAATGRKEVILPAHAFTPPRSVAPLSLESFDFSDDESRLLLFTNSKKVWRHNNRGDYWVVDIASRELKKLGGDAAPSSLRFAKFSPDGSRVAYVRDNNLYVQDLNDMRVTALTADGSTTIINGTFDWVYEEELGLRDGFRWSPDGRFITYWQLDSSGVRDFFLINDTDGLYSLPVAIPYPKAGEQNSAARVGVVSAHGGDTVWLELPGDPRNNYPAQVDWTSNATELVVQQFNRIQNTNLVLWADARTGRTRTVLTEIDDAWVENANTARWVKEGKEFLWLSERSGWRRAYRVSHDGEHLSRITRDQMDVMAIDGVDEEKGWLYFDASPGHATQRYLYRVPLAGGRATRVTPAGQAGSHTYQLSPDAHWAIHTWSSFTNPPVTELVRLPEHTAMRVLEDNHQLRENLKKLRRPGSEFFRIGIDPKVTLDGWCLSPPEFDPEKKYPAVFYVYGEPGGQTVLDAWRGNSLLWHWLLAQRGYFVISVDGRGTPAPRGRAWRKSIHRQIGTLNSADQAPRSAPSCASAVGWTPPGWASGAGAAAAPPLSMPSSSIRISTTPPWPSPPSPTSVTTTAFTRSAIWACRPTTRRAIVKAPRLPTPLNSRATCSSSTERATTMSTFKEPKPSSMNWFATISPSP